MGPKVKEQILQVRKHLAGRKQRGTGACPSLGAQGKEDTSPDSLCLFCLTVLRNHASSLSQV